jgi:hypothetical protein
MASGTTIAGAAPVRAAVTGYCACRARAADPQERGGGR